MNFVMINMFITIDMYFHLLILGCFKLMGQGSIWNWKVASVSAFVLSVYSTAGYMLEAYDFICVYMSIYHAGSLSYVWKVAAIFFNWCMSNMFTVTLETDTCISWDVKLNDLGGALKMAGYLLVVLVVDCRGVMGVTICCCFFGRSRSCNG